MQIAPYGNKSQQITDREHFCTVSPSDNKREIF